MLSAQFECKGNLISCGIISEERLDHSRSSKTLVRLPKAKFSEWVVETPDPHLCTVWAFETDTEYLLSLSEIELAKTLLNEGTSSEQLFDRGLIAVKMRLAQTPLTSTVMGNVHALAGQVRVRLKREASLLDALERQQPLIQPTPGSNGEFLDYLVEKYREKMKGIGTAVVLFSGGWDSRLELALVRAALPKGVRVVLAHIKTSPAEMDVVRTIASEVGAELIVGDADKMLQYGLAWPALMDAVRTESTWRPTVPVYGTFVGLLKAAYPDGFAFGFSPFPLKGRDYDHPIRDTVPRKGRVRLIEPGAEVLGLLHHDGQSHVATQKAIWRSLLSGTGSWSDTQVRDWFNWNGYYANGYSHRVRSLKLLGIDPIYAHSDVVARLMGLPDEEKRGTSFIQFALKRLLPEIENIPILASTGDISRGTDKLGGEFKDSSEPKLDARHVFEFRSDGDTSLYHPDVLADPPLFRMSVWASLFALNGGRHSIVRDVLAAGSAIGGDFTLNATQIADFVSESSRAAG